MLSKATVTNSFNEKQISEYDIIRESIKLRSETAWFLHTLQQFHPELYEIEISRIDKLLGLCKNWSETFDSFCRQGGE